MFLLKLIVLFFCVVFISSCNSGKTDEEMEELWSKAQTTGKIIERSGTPFNSGKNKELALRDASTRLQSGGGLLGNKGLSVSGILGNDKDNKSEKVGTIGMSINPYLWRGSLETINFMPLNSADPIGGTILTDWYSTTENQNLPQPSNKKWKKSNIKEYGRTNTGRAQPKVSLVLPCRRNTLH